VVALNKVDRLGPAARRRAVQRLTSRYPGAVPVSALNTSGFAELHRAIDAATRGDSVPLELLVPYGSESVLAELRAIGGVERTEYGERGTRAWGWAPRHIAHRFEPYEAPTGSH